MPRTRPLLGIVSGVRTGAGEKKDLVQRGGEV